MPGDVLLICGECHCASDGHAKGWGRVHVRSPRRYRVHQRRDRLSYLCGPRVRVATRSSSGLQVKVASRPAVSWRRGLFHSRDGPRLDGVQERNTRKVSLRSDVDVAGVRVQARHLPELVTRLRRAGEPYVAYKVQRALGVRTIHVTFGPFEREAIVRAIDDRPRKFSELYAVLLRELKQRRELGDATPSRRPRRSPLQAARGVGSPPRLENDAADASGLGTPGRPNVTVTKDTLLEIFRQSLERTRSKPPQPSYQQIADDNDVKRTWVTPIVKWAEKHPQTTLHATRVSKIPARFSTIVRN